MNQLEIAEQDAARRAIDAAIAKTEETRQELMRAVHRARAAQVPVLEIAARARVTRATIYIWLKEADDG